jgi:hypothetical protein
MATPAAVHLRDTRANQPAADVGNAGVLFCVTDEGDILERSNGTTWESYSPASVDETNVNITGGSISGINDLAVADGGTGASSLTAYAPIFGGTTGTAAVQSGAVGSSGHVLTSNGPGAIATFQAPAGSGGSTSTAAHASRPAAGNAGNLFLPNDSFYLERDSGSAWAPWGPIFPMTPPVDGDFAWVNQGAASVSTTKGGIFVQGTADGSASLRCRVKTAPATPYTITACFLPLVPAIDFAAVGLLFRQSSDGKIATFQLTHNVNWALDANKFTNETTFSAQYVSRSQKTMHSPLFIRISDNGTNRICSYSTDGQNFVAVHTVGRTDFLTANQVGFFLNSQQTTQAPAATLLSWKET